MLAYRNNDRALARIEEMAWRLRVDPMFLRLAWCVAAAGRSFAGARVTAHGSITGICATGAVRFF